MLPSGLLLLSFAICSQAATYLNSTSTPTSNPSTSHITSAPSFESISCSVSCFVNATNPRSYFWQPYYINETITAATLVIIVNTRYNLTTTSLQLASLPSGYTLPEINDKGTHIATVTYPRSGKNETTVVAFPTRFMWWADGYTWNGTLQSSVQGQGRNECLTATEFSSYVPFTSFPQPEISMPTHSMGPDPEGWMFKPTSEGGVQQWYVSRYKDEPAWQQCSILMYPLPLEAIFTARFMTATVTSFDDTKPSETPKPADRLKAGPSETPEASPNPPESSPTEQPKNSPSAASEAGPSPTPVEPPKASETGNPPGVSEPPKPGASNEQQPAATNTPPPGQSNAEQPPLSSGRPKDEYQAQSAAEQLIPVGSETLRLSADKSTTAVILPDGKTLEPGSTYTADGIPVYIPTSGPGSEIVVGEATVTFHPTAASPAAAQYLTIGSETMPVSFADISSEGIVLPNGVTLRPGEATTVDGTSYSLGPSGTAIVVDGSTLSFNPSSDSYIVVGGSTIPVSAVTAPAGQGILLPNGETLLPGSTTTVDGTLISLAPSGTALIVDGTTVPLPNPALPTPPAYATASNGGVILPDGQTLLPGSATTVDGTTFSVDPSGTLIIADQTTTQTVTPPTSAYAIASNGGIILPNGQTLLPGSKTTIDGTTFSVDPSGTLIVADQSTTKTIGLKTTGPASSASRTGTESEGETSSAVWRAKGTTSASSTTSKGAGQYIWQGLGGDKAPAKGEASGHQHVLHTWFALGIVIGGAAVLL